ncbi:MAG: hypothetical protein U1F70_01970 [Candidatus Competibacteraceae bacterium]
MPLETASGFSRSPFPVLPALVVPGNPERQPAVAFTSSASTISTLIADNISEIAEKYEEKRSRPDRRC